MSNITIMDRIKNQMPLGFRCFLKRHLTYKVAFAKSLSQARQDLWLIEEVFYGKRNGYFLEIGSADGIALNNTYLLEKRFGWQGICIEANEKLFRELSVNRTARVVNACIDSAAGEVAFLENGLLSGIVSSDTDNAVGRIDLSKTVLVKTLPLVDVLEKCGAPNVIDYASIDVEGAEMRILSHFPFDRYTFLSLSIERPPEKLHQLLLGNGYVLVKVIPFLDNLYIHESFSRDYANNLARLSKAYFTGAP